MLRGQLEQMRGIARAGLERLGIKAHDAAGRRGPAARPETLTDVVRRRSASARRSAQRAVAHGAPDDAGGRFLATDADAPRTGRRRRPARHRMARRHPGLRLVCRVRRGSQGPGRDAGRSGPDVSGYPGPRGFPDLRPVRSGVRHPRRPRLGGTEPGSDATGDGTAVNVRALSQICPHLGCRPNPCIQDFWFHCPCHQSRYDRLGIKAAGERYGPAPRGMDRFAIEVDADGVLTIDTGWSRSGRSPLPLATRASSRHASKEDACDRRAATLPARLAPPIWRRDERDARTGPAAAG